MNRRQVDKLVEVPNCSMDGKVTLAQLRWTVEGLEGSDRSYLERIKSANRQRPPKKPSNIDEEVEAQKNQGDLPPP